MALATDAAWGLRVWLVLSFFWAGDISGCDRDGSSPYSSESPGRVGVVRGASPTVGVALGQSTALVQASVHTHCDLLFEWMLCIPPHRKGGG